jgi:hypothetical protein
MPRAVIHLPVQEKYLRRYQALYLEVLLNLEVQTHQTGFVLLPSLFDTGTHFTTIPMASAQQLGISYGTSKPVWLRGATAAGPIQGYLSPLWFSFAALPQWQFPCECCFTPQPLTRSLLCLQDILRHFAITTDRRIPPQFPSGGLILVLREDHGGIPRS